MRLKATYPVTEICQVLSYARSSAYYQSKKASDVSLRQAIQRLAGDYPTYGYRRITAMLNREGWTVNHKRIQRLMGEMRLTAAQKRRKKRTTNSNHGYPRYPNLVKEMEIVCPDQVWVSDITYIQLHWETVYLAVIMDVYTRAIRGWHLGRSLEQELTLTALKQALQIQVPEIHHTIKVFNMQPRSTSTCSRSTRCRSVWRRRAGQKKMASLNVLCAQSRKKRWSFRNTATTMMLISALVSF